MRDDDTATVTDQASPDTVQPTDAKKRKSKMAKSATKAKTAPKARKAVKGKTSARKAVKKASTTKARVVTGLDKNGHRPDSIKAKAHNLFHKVGDNDKARAQVLKLGVKDTTVSSWFSSFRTAK
jgi:hypothetical protein